MIAPVFSLRRGRGMGRVSFEPISYTVMIELLCPEKSGISLAKILYSAEDSPSGKTLS